MLNADALLSGKPLVNHSDKTFAMLNFPSAVKQTPYEGASQSETLHYYHQLLCSQPALFYTILTQAVYDDVVAALADMIYFNQLFQQKADIDTVLVAIETRSVDRGHCYFLSGWVGQPGHFAGLKLTRLDKGVYSTPLINQGAGMEFHRLLKKVGPQEQLDHQSEPHLIKLNKKSGRAFIHSMLALNNDFRTMDMEGLFVGSVPATFGNDTVKLNLKSNRDAVQGYSQIDLYAPLVFLGEPQHELPNLQRAAPQQVTGTCAVTSIEAVVRDVLLSHDTVTPAQIHRYELLVRTIANSEAFKAYRNGSVQLALLQWSLREFYLRIALHGADVLLNEEVEQYTRLANTIHERVAIDAEQAIALACQAKLLPSVRGAWHEHKKIGELRRETADAESDNKPQSPIVLDLQSCEPQALLSYLDQAIAYFKVNQDKLALLELREFMQSLAVTDDARYWEQLSDTDAASVIQKLRQLVQLSSALDKYNYSPNKKQRRLYRFEIALTAYDIAAHLAERIPPLSLQNYALALDDCFTDQQFYFDVESYQTIKKLSANFQKRCQNKQTVLGNSVNQHAQDATQAYIMQVKLHSMTRQIALDLLKKLKCIKANVNQLPDGMLFNILMTKQCPGQDESGQPAQVAFPSARVLGELIFDLLVLSATTHALGEYQDAYTTEDDINVARPQLTVTANRYHHELSLQQALTARGPDNAENELLRKIRQFFPKISAAEGEVIDFAENTLYHPLDDLTELRQAQNKQRAVSLPYEIRALGKVSVDGDTYYHDFLDEATHEDLRHIACAPSLQVVRALAWAEFNIDKLSHPIVQQRLFELIFAYGKLDDALARNSENTLSLIDNFLTTGFNTYRFDPHDITRYGHDDSPQQRAFLWLCRCQHHLRRYVTVSAKLTGYHVYSLWPDIATALKPYLDKSMTRIDRLRVARLILSSYAFTDRLPPSEYATLMACRIILQMNPFNGSTGYDAMVSNELDYIVEKIWIKHRQHVAKTFETLNAEELSLSANRVLKILFPEHNAVAWQWHAGQLQSLQSALVIDVQRGALWQDGHLAEDKGLWLNGRSFFHLLGLDQKTLALMSNGYVDKQGHPVDEPTEYHSVTTQDKQWEFLYYSGSRNVFAAFRQLTLAGISLRFQLLHHDSENQRPQDYFQQAQLQNPFENFATQTTHQYWQEVGTSRVLVCHKDKPTQAYLYAPEQGWQALKKHEDKWHYSNTVILNLNDPQNQFERDWADWLIAKVGMTGVKAEAEILDGGICELKSLTLTDINLSFKLHEERLESVEFPGFYLSEKSSITALNGLQTVLILENKAGAEKILVPAYRLKRHDGNAAFSHHDITTTEPIVKWYRKERATQTYYQYTFTLDGELHGDVVAAELYLALIYRSQGDYQRAMRAILRSYEHNNNDEELSALSAQVLERQDQTPLGAAIDCHLACRMTRHTSKYTKQADQWLGSSLPKLIQYALGQYNFYKKTAFTHREDISIVPEYLRLSKEDIECLKELLELFNQAQAKRRSGMFDMFPAEPEVIAHTLTLHNQFTAPRLANIDRLKHLEYSWRVNIDDIVDDIGFDDARHRRLGEERQPFLRVFYDRDNHALNALKQEYGTHPSDHPGLEYLRTHFVDLFESAISHDEDEVRRLKYEIFCLLENDNKLEHRHERLLSSLVFVVNHPEKFRQFKQFATARECFHRVTEQCNRLLRDGLENKCELYPGRNVVVEVVNEALLPNPYQRTDALSFNISATALPAQWQHPLLQLVQQHLNVTTRRVSERPFPLSASGLRNATVLAQNLLNVYQQGHADNQAKEKKTYVFASDADVKQLRESLDAIRADNQQQLQRMQEEIEQGLVAHPAATRQGYLLQALYGGEQVVRPQRHHVMQALQDHDVSMLAHANHFLDQTQLNELLGKAIVYALLQSQTDQASEVLGMLDGKSLPQDFDYYPLQLLAQTLDKFRNYDVLTYPEFLIYEYTTQRMLRPGQASSIVELIEHIQQGIVNEDAYRHALKQFAAGGGKTAVMIPLLSLIFARLGLLPIIFNTNELYKIGVEEIPRSFRVSTQQQLEVIERDIDHVWTQEELIRLLLDLYVWQEQKKCVLIKGSTWYSIHTSLKLAYANGEPDLAKRALAVLRFFFQHTIKLEDEGHLISDPLQESIKTYGPMQSIAIEHQELFLAFYDYLMGRVEGSEDIAKLVGIADKSKVAVDTEDLAHIELRLIDHILKLTLYEELDQAALKQYLLQDERTRPAWLQSLHTVKQRIADNVVLARAFTKMHLPHILTLQYLKDYGGSVHLNDLTAAPKHDAKDVTSHFSDQMLVMALTIQFYEQRGTPPVFVRMILEQLKREHVKERQWNAGQTQAEKFLNLVVNATFGMQSFDGLTNARLLEYGGQPQIALHPAMIKRFLMRYALPQIKTPLYRVVSTPANLQAGFRHSIMLTATPGPRETYPVFLADQDCFFDQAFESEVIDVLLSAQNEMACLIDMAHSPAEFFSELQTKCPKLYQAMTGLIDRGALLSSHQAADVMSALLDSVETDANKENAAFFAGESMQLRSKEHAHLNMAIPGTRIEQALQRYGIKLEEFLLFLFLDLSKTTGTDVKRPYNDRAGLTIGKEQTVTEVIQAAMRERQLLWDDAQSIVWILFKSLYQQIDDKPEFDATQLFYWLIQNEAKRISTKVVMRAYQGIYQQLEDIIWWRIFSGQAQYDDYSHVLEKTFELSPYYRYEIESIYADPKTVLRAYIQQLCKHMSLSTNEIPTHVNHRLEKIINDTARMIEFMRFPHGAELSEKVNQEQHDEVEELQESIQEERIKSLFDGLQNFKFNLERYRKGELTDVFAHNGKQYRHFAVPTCDLELPSLRFDPNHFTPFQWRRQQDQITGLKPIHMVLVKVQGSQYEFAAITAMGAEFIAHEMIRANLDHPSQAYAIVGLYGDILYNSASMTSVQLRTLKTSAELGEILTFVGLLNGQMINPPELARLVKHYQWTQVQMNCLLSHVQKNHVSQHTIVVNRAADLRQLEEVVVERDSLKHFPTLRLQPSMDRLPRNLSLSFATVPASVFANPLLGKSSTPVLTQAFQPPRVVTFYEPVSSFFTTEEDLNFVMQDCQQAFAEQQYAEQAQSSSAATLSTPWSYLTSLWSWLGIKTPMSTDLAPLSEFTESTSQEPSPHQCIPTLMGNEEDGYIPTLVCHGQDYQVHVFAKPSRATAVSTQHASHTGYTGDTYDPKSCRPIEFFGRPSVTCAGEKTTFVYTPALPPRPLENLGANIALARVAVHVGYSAYCWVSEALTGKSEQKEYLNDDKYFYEQYAKLTAALDKAEQSFKTHGAKRPAADTTWIRWGLDDYQNDCQDLLTAYQKGRLSAETLAECDDDIGYFTQEVSKEMAFAQQASESAQLQPLYTEQYFKTRQPKTEYASLVTVPQLPGHTNVSRSLIPKQ